MSFCVVVFDSDYAHPRGRSFLVSTGLPPEAEIRESSEFRAMIALQPTMQPMWHDDQIFSVVRFDIDKLCDQDRCPTLIVSKCGDQRCPKLLAMLGRTGFIDIDQGNKWGNKMMIMFPDQEGNSIIVVADDMIMFSGRTR
jgi:hypothetical protein